MHKVGPMKFYDQYEQFENGFVVVGGVFLFYWNTQYLKQREDKQTKLGGKALQINAMVLKCLKNKIY